MTFKYQEYIDELLAQGLKMPELHSPDGINAYRFVFSGDNVNNHKPVCIQTRQDDYLTMKDSQSMLYLASITKKKQNAGIPHCANRLRELQRLSEIPCVVALLRTMMA